MTSIILTVVGANIHASVSGPLTSGMVGIPVTIQYDAAWNGLTKNLVCRCGQWGPDRGETRTVRSIETTATVAHEVMKADMHLYLGVEGYSADGKLVIPTRWADCGKILSGANAGADPSTKPELPFWAQLQTEINQVKTLVETSQVLTLPVDENGCPDYGTVGWYAASDGKGGITWVEAAPDTGSGNTGSSTHGIIWDLVNVTSSNTIASVDDGESLTAVLTAAEGYTLGDVTVTMGGEVLTGVWNADTATVTIATVTGDVIISCVGVVVYEEIPVEINWTNGSDASGVFTESSGSLAYISHVDLIDATKHDLKIHMPFDAEYCTEGSTQKALKVYVYSDSNQESFVGKYKLETGEVSATSNTWDYLTWDTDLIIPSGYYVRIFMNKSGCSSNANLLSYFQNHTVAYLVTPTATAEASVAQAVDNDYAMDYGIATLALVTDESASTKTGIDSAYAAVIEEAKNAWMLAANGDMDKIPLMIHTDQHGHMNGSNKLFSFVSEIVNWYDISKVINLGDTTSNWVDSDTEHPLTECAALESYLEAMADVPFSKRIEIFGNHDTWDATSGGAYQGIAPQNCLHKYFRNIYARRADNYGNFVVKDDNYNVKYVVVSGFAYDSELGGYTHYVMHPDSIRWAIAEMEKADGYDIILLSHVPLDSFTYKNMDALWSGRKAKTSGTVTDEYGNSYAFDFTKCDGELLCALHGHNHADNHAYVGDLLSAWFDGMLNDNACHFVLVDRANRQLNVWKVDSTPQVQNYQISFDQTTE